MANADNNVLFEQSSIRHPTWRGRRAERRCPAKRLSPTDHVYTLPPLQGVRPPYRPFLFCTAMANERTTEGIVRDFIRGHAVEGQVLEEQASSDPAIKRSLNAASKSGGGAGKPEFILRVPDAPNLVIVFECKANTRRHASPNHDRPADFAVDGVLHYATHLSKYFDVIAIGVSGTSQSSLKISTYRQLRGSDQAEPLFGPGGAVRGRRAGWV